MNFWEYQINAKRTMNAELSEQEQLANLGLGLAGEAGEVVELIKKHVYHGHEIDKVELVSELGDALWYLTNICDTIGMPLELVALHNVDKLKKRYPEGFDPKRSQVRED